MEKVVPGKPHMKWVVRVLRKWGSTMAFIDGLTDEIIEEEISVLRKKLAGELKTVYSKSEYVKLGIDERIRQVSRVNGFRIEIEKIRGGLR